MRAEVALMKESLDVNFRAIKNSQNADWALKPFKSLAHEVMESWNTKTPAKLSLDIPQL